MSWVREGTVHVIASEVNQARASIRTGQYNIECILHLE